MTGKRRRGSGTRPWLTRSLPEKIHRMCPSIFCQSSPESSLHCLQAEAAVARNARVAHPCLPSHHYPWLSCLLSRSQIDSPCHPGGRNHTCHVAPFSQDAKDLTLPFSNTLTATIVNDAWIGIRALFLRGACIGMEAIVGAGERLTAVPDVVGTHHRCPDVATNPRTALSRCSQSIKKTALLLVSGLNLVTGRPVPYRAAAVMVGRDRNW